MYRIFISHSHGDKVIADALKQLLKGLFAHAIEVRYSSDKELDGGIKPGENWFNWIVKEVKAADVALILLTPASIQKPWVIWEAGAVAGAAFATQTELARVLPLTFGLKSTEIPTPFAHTQVSDGTHEPDIVRLLDLLLERFGDKLGKKETVEFGAKRAETVRTYLTGIGQVLRRLPLTITEAAVQEWLGRLSDLEREERYSETQVMENWLDVTFGRDAEDKQRPFDVRVHRRLGELYAASEQPSEAARQFNLARQLAPRDIFLLRRLGKAYLDLRDTVRAREIIEEIENLDLQAFEINGENAALKARFLETSGNRLGARDVLQTAFTKLRQSYYVGDLLGQALVGLNDLPRAKEVYGQVKKLLQELREHNVWTYAAALSAAIVCADKAAIEQNLGNLESKPPSRGEFESIERGITKLVSATAGDTSILTRLRQIEIRQ